MPDDPVTPISPPLAPPFSVGGADTPPPPPRLQPPPPQLQTVPAAPVRSAWGRAVLACWGVALAGAVGAGVISGVTWPQNALLIAGFAGMVVIGVINGRRLRAEKIAAAQAWADALARTEAAQAGQPSGAPANPWDLTAGGGSHVDPNLPAPFWARSARVTRRALFRAAVGALCNPYSYLAFFGLGLLFVVIGGFIGGLTAPGGAAFAAIAVPAVIGAIYGLGGVAAFLLFILALTIPLTVYSRTAGGMATVSLHTDGVRDRTPERALFLPWARITGIREVYGDLHFWISGSLGAVVLRDAFATDADRAAFLLQAERLWRSRGGNGR